MNLNEAVKILKREGGYHVRKMGRNQANYHNDWLYVDGQLMTAGDVIAMATKLKQRQQGD